MGTAILSAALCLTNLAGNAMTATPVRINGTAVVLARASMTQTVALAAFPTTEQARIRAALAEAKGNRTLAAKKLGISRRTIYRKIEEYGLDG